MKVAIAQLNPVVGDITGNLARLRSTLAEVAPLAPDLVVFPELFIIGYPPLDLLERPDFVARAEAALGEVARVSGDYPDVGIMVGAVVRTGRSPGRPLQNAAVLFSRGREVARRAKTLLPTYDVFDEVRYFAPADRSEPVEFRGEKLGIAVCEDAWRGEDVECRACYDRDPVAELAAAGATLFVVISASPFSAGKDEARFRLLSGHARRCGVPFVFVNQVGGNDELVFDGRSMVVDSRGRPALVLDSFREEVRIADTRAEGDAAGYRPEDRVDAVYRALVLGVGDYARKCGFEKAVLGLSGGIDSAVVACIAAEALGPGNVLGVTMPSPFSSRGSVTHSRALARRLGIGFDRVPIAPLFNRYLRTLARHLAGREADETEENIQARIRGNILMALSNRYGHLVLASGNKSELAVGYCTLYGDMSGGLTVLADVPKTLVYELARHINRRREVIPRAVIEKPPSAELRPGQLDQDTLPPYDVLDDILARYVDDGRSRDEIVAAGHRCETVDWVVGRVARNEYKRYQAAPGIKVSGKAFGRGRRMPLAARYEG